MKFTLFVLIIGFSCVLAKSLNGNLAPPLLNTDTVSAESEVDMQRLNINWSALNGVLGKVLSSWKGFQCIKKDLLKMNEATTKFMSEIKKCSSEANEIDDALNEKATNENDGQLMAEASIDGLEIDENLYYNSEISPKLFSQLHDAKTQLADKIYDDAGIEKAYQIGICAFKASKDLQKVFIEFSDTIVKCLSQ